MGPTNNRGDVVDVDEMVKFASEVLNKRKNIVIDEWKELTYSQLLQLGTSAGGARAKAIIAWNEQSNEIRSGQIEAGDGFDYWLIKFDGVGKNGDHNLEDSVEYTHYQMAIDAGIEMSECRILPENGRNHFMTKRFDRVDGKKVHMQTLSAIGHIDYNIPGLCSYEQAAMYMDEMRLGVNEIEKLFRRMVFNVIAVNQDDHVKNISFLMDRKGTWRLAPAYDLTFAYSPENKWLKAHQMRINQKTENITREDIITSGINMGIKKTRINAIIDKVTDAIGKWQQFAEKSGIREETYEIISDIMHRNSI
ncbi:type II toxin-antitoxin system HipA family toxin [Butyrivibrio sp. AE3004]|uniref:type II toxin-antitoxin system HipA family toxin n=1 Tax=Butyrivibrio sp. AE3004 TaxID=1506994 RepID=UPI000691E1C0|nr:HipA domain-containing protein [Butyrivibrio sp. AE3004]